MFEKEAKEYAHEHCCDSCKNLQARYRKVYQDGAEFGYNKANEWHYRRNKMNTILAYTLQDKNDLCAILSRNGYIVAAYNIVSMTENTYCGKQWRIDYYNPKEEQDKHIEQLKQENT